MIRFRKEINGARIEVRVRDVDGDGDPDVELRVNGVSLGWMPMSKLAKNIRDEVRRFLRRIRKGKQRQSLRESK